MAPKVSIIIPTYNCAHYLSGSIESVLGQTFQDFEIIVIDDGSNDNTKEIVENYRQGNPEKIRYIYQENQGLACARNTGLRQARGNLIALLDADDAWLPERLEETVLAIESDEDVGLVHANITRISKNGDVIGTKIRDQRYLSGNIFEHIFLRNAHLACPTILFRKKCCDRVGLFDENLTRLGCEDRDLWLRISQSYKIKHINKVLAYYRMSNSNMSSDKSKMLQARLYVIDKFYPLNSNQQWLRKQALARVYRDSGDELLMEHKFREARKNYLKAISYMPVSFWSWVNLMKSLIKVKV